jgi:hypothetical protein
MKYSQEQLTSIEQLASLYTRPSEIAILLDIPEEEFKSDIALDGHPARKAYILGKLRQKTKIRKQMAALAAVGSPAAIEMSEKALLDMEDDE